MVNRTYKQIFALLHLQTLFYTLHITTVVGGKFTQNARLSFIILYFYSDMLFPFRSLRMNSFSLEFPIMATRVSRKIESANSS